MINHAAFSALRLRRVFPPEELASYPFYVEVDPEGDFDVEYLGGQWHEELIDGVVGLWASGCVAAAAVRDRPGAYSASLERFTRALHAGRRAETTPGYPGA